MGRSGINEVGENMVTEVLDLVDSSLSVWVVEAVGGWIRGAGGDSLLLLPTLRVLSRRTKSLSKVLLMENCLNSALKGTCHSLPFHHSIGILPTSLLPGQGGVPLPHFSGG